MFNTVALILRPDEIRLFIALFAALVSAAFAAVVRRLRRILARLPGQGRNGIRRPLARALSGPITVGLAATVAPGAALTRGWIIDWFGRLRWLWTRWRRPAPPH